LLLSQRGFHARQGGARPMAPQGHKYNPLGAPDGYSLTSIHQRAVGDDYKEEDAQVLPQRRRCWRTAWIEHSLDASTTFNGTMLSILME
jgi:hypothetical protein